MGTRLVVTVSDRYRDLIHDWAEEGVRQCGGQNKFAAYTSTVLAKYGMKGFASEMISRWRRRQITEGLSDRTVRRIGLLKGFSDDPEEAQRLAYRWLNDPNFDAERAADFAGGLQRVANAVTTSVTAASAVDQIRVGQFSAIELRDIVIAAVEVLSASITGEAMPKNVKTPLSHMVKGLMAEDELSVEDLASEIEVHPQDIERSLNGQPISLEACQKLAARLNLKLQTLLDWGVCAVDLK